MAPLQWRDWQLLVLDFPHPGPPSPCTVLLRPLYKQVKEVKDFIVVIYTKRISISVVINRMYALTSSTSRVTPSLLVCTPHPPDLLRERQSVTDIWIYTNIHLVKRASINSFNIHLVAF